jgi:hypothetical protein
VSESLTLTLRRTLGSARFRYTSELELQDGIAELFTARGIAFERERQLGPDRVDFFIAGIAIEVKIEGSLSDVTRQLHRYSEHPDVTGVVLVTTRARHNAMPNLMTAKPVDVIHLLGSVF